jgi:uncharacterized membrane-anchored protein YhcB (DUF1043 family)
MSVPIVIGIVEAIRTDYSLPASSRLRRDQPDNFLKLNHYHHKHSYHFAHALRIFETYQKSYGYANHSFNPFPGIYHQ